jgi:hypothetical protein
MPRQTGAPRGCRWKGFRKGKPCCYLFVSVYFVEINNIFKIILIFAEN